VPELAFVICPRQDWFIGEFIETLRYELKLQAVPSTIHRDGFPEPRPQTVYVLVAPNDYVALEGEAALPDEDVLQRTMLLYPEPPGEIEPDKDGELFRRGGAVFCMDQRSVAVLRRAGIPARHLSPGYSKLRDAFDPGAERPIDVMFLGSHSLRRTRQLGRCAPVLARRNCLLQISDGSRPNPSGSSSFLAEGKADLLRQTKVLLNVHRGEDPALERLRALDAIHAGAVVVTEHSSGIAPLVPGEDLLLASPDSLPYVLDAALRNDELLLRLRTNAHERIRSLLPFAFSVSVFRAAAVEILGRPVSPSASLGRRATVSIEQWTAPPPDGEPGNARLRHDMKEIGIEVIELRRELSRIEQIARSGSAAPSETEIVDETPTWSDGRDRRVTVITSLTNQAGMIGRTLDSLAGSWFRDFELVIVDDASHDGSAEIAREWLQTNCRLPAMLVRHPFSRGLGAMRNTALDSARAPYCLILDAGSEIYPRALEVLVGTLDAMADVAFAYPIVEMCGLTEAMAAAGGDYLLNVFGWEPGRLRLWSHCEGLGLFRTECLRALGGFATESQLAGWEDYDLWCRLAERSWRGQLVPQILGRRRESVAGSSALARIPPMAALIERAPRVLAHVVLPA
jgi:hypothetical protein